MSRLGVLLLAMLFTGLACDDEPVGPVTDPALDQAVAGITAADVADHVGVIAHDSMGGRDTPSPGLEATAGFVAARFEALGVDPAGTDGYYQRFGFSYTVRDTTSLLLELAAGGGPALVHGKDYLMFGAQPQRGDTVGPLLWAGDADSPVGGGLPEAGAVVLYDLPVTRFDLDAVQATADAAHETVRGDGVAIGFIVPTGFTEEEMDRAVRQSESHSRWIPQFWIREPAADSILAMAGLDLDTLRADGPQLLDDSLRVRALLSEVEVTPPNVVGVLPGSDPALSGEYVVLSAHFDHIGIGFADAAGDSIYNGADDNASGTVAVLEIAEALASLDTPPARSVVFLLVSGEEYGLVGSAYFARHPTVPLASMVANINFDMVGRNDPGQIIGIGRSYSTLGPLADSLARHHTGLGLSMIADPAPGENLFGRSDQLVFACRDVPALFFHSGLHEDYHGAGDEAQLLDTDKIARVARLGVYLVHEVANRTRPPAWTPAGRQAVQDIGYCP